MASSHSEEASAVIWPWKEEEHLQRFHLGLTSPIVQAIVMGIVAGLFAWRHHVTPAKVVGSLALVVLVGGLIFPKGFDRFTSFMQTMGLKVGEFLSAIILIPVYYLLFTPIGLWFKVRGRDPLQRDYPCDEASCWTVRDTEEQKKADYTRQF